MNNQKASIEHGKTTKMKIVRKCQSGSCVDGCDMEWYEGARQVLKLNYINPFMFANAEGFTRTWKRQVLQFIDSWSSKLWQDISVKTTSYHLTGIY